MKYGAVRKFSLFLSQKPACVMKNGVVRHCCITACLYLYNYLFTNMYITYLYLLMACFIYFDSYLSDFCFIFLDINYFHCLRIVELLKISEHATKNIFGGYSSKRMKVLCIYVSCIIVKY